MRKNQWKCNSGQEEANIVHNQFTKYLVTAVQCRKWDYINQQNKDVLNDNMLYSALPEELFHIDHYFLFEFPVLEYLKNDDLIRALKAIGERDRYVFLSHVLEEKTFNELAEELNLSYKGIAAIYYRCIQKIKKRVEGKENEF